MTEMHGSFHVYIRQSGPREWMAQEVTTGFASTGESRDEALALFKSVWSSRAPFTLIDGAPPRSRRDGGAEEAASRVEREPAPKLDDAGAHVFNKLIRQFAPNAKSVPALWHFSGIRTPTSEVNCRSNRLRPKAASVPPPSVNKKTSIFL
jgi:hypothetical protein